MEAFFSKAGVLAVFLLLISVYELYLLFMKEIFNINKKYFTIKPNSIPRTHRLITNLHSTTFGKLDL